MDSDMNILKNWLATIVGAAIAVILFILFTAAASDSSSDFKGIFWLLPILAIAIGVVIDLVRQKKLKLPA
jgi:membrane protein DedA with SNARE-associated domain